MHPSNSYQGKGDSKESKTDLLNGKRIVMSGPYSLLDMTLQLPPVHVPSAETRSRRKADLIVKGAEMTIVPSMLTDLRCSSCPRDVLPESSDRVVPETIATFEIPLAFHDELNQVNIVFGSFRTSTYTETMTRNYTSIYNNILPIILCINKLTHLTTKR